MSEPQRLDYLKRFIDASQKGTFTMDEELNILSYIIERYKFVTVSEYARQKNITPAGVLHRIDKGDVMYINIAGIKMIIPD